MERSKPTHTSPTAIPHKRVAAPTKSITASERNPKHLETLKPTAALYGP